MDRINFLPIYRMDRRGHSGRVMITTRPADARGHADHGWLNSYHTFSFANYYDPRFMGFRALRVINEDRVQPARGFGTHPHRDMEIVSYVLEGALEHKDSMGTGSVIRPGDVQRMSAGTGVTHSEYNGSKTEQVHFLQIWIAPERSGIKPSYEQRAFSREDKDGRLRLVASRDGRDGSVALNADAALYAGVFADGQRAELPLAPGRHGYVHVARGEVRVNGQTLRAGDGAALTDEPAVLVEGAGGGEVLVFDLA
jgi:redox-sensitive bicupin YhaK (pirin superfamily)